MWRSLIFHISHLQQLVKLFGQALRIQTTIVKSAEKGLVIFINEIIRAAV